MLRFVCVLAVLAAFCLVLVGCESDPKTVMITQENEETFLEDIQEMKGLTVDEARMLHAYVLRTSMVEAFGGEATSLVGKSIGDIIEEERHFEAEAQRLEDEQEQLAADARAKEDAIAAELRQAIGLSVYEKSFLASDVMAGRYSDYIVIKCTYENRSDKDVRAFTGTIRFTDLFDKLIFESGLTISDPIATGDHATWDGTIEYNQFMDNHQSFRNTELTDMKVIWLPSQVLFADGTKVGDSSS